MCNAWNHSPACDCGYGGKYYGDSDDLLRQTLFSHTSSSLVSASAVRNRNTLIKDAKTYKTPCWWCGAKVHYHTNGYGDSVLFDSLGSPWPVHPCWADYWEGKKQLRVRQSSRPSTIGIIQRIEQFENSGRLSEYKAQWVQPSHWMDGTQRKDILAQAIKQVEVSFIPDELSVASRLGITRDELQRSYGDLYTIDSRTKGIKLNVVRRGKEFGKASNNLRFQIVAVQKQRKSPPSPKKRKTNQG